MNKVTACPYCQNSKSSVWCNQDWQGNRYLQCRQCRAVYLSDCTLSPSYGSEYWHSTGDPDGNIRDLTQERSQKLKNWYGDIIRTINSRTPGRILDYGCGLGFLLSAINPLWERFGYEPFPDTANYVRTHFENIQVGESVDELSTFSSSPFDAIICYHVLEHLADPVKTFSNLTAMLKPGGLLIVGTPNIHSWCARWFRGNFRLLGNGHLCLMGPSHLRNLYRQYGFTLLREEYPFFWTQYFTIKNLLRLFVPWRVSPACYGNIMTFYGRKNDLSPS